MAKVVVFGNSSWADLAHFYLTHDSPHEVVAFTVDGDFLKEERHRGLPVVPFGNLEEHYPPGDFSLFIPISFKRMNHLRAEKYQNAKDRGYKLISYVSSKATTWPDFKCGDNCFIFEDNTIQPFCRIGNNVTLWSGNHIGHHSTIGDHCFISSHVVISGGVVVEPYCFLGVNTSVRDHVTIGERSVIGMGGMVTKSLEPGGVYVGAPVKRTGESEGQKI